MSWRDEWPSMPDGKPYDGKHLWQLVQAGKSPFDSIWDVQLLIREIEENLNSRVTDIPSINKGSNNYGFSLQTSDGRDLVARLARGDVNMPDFDGFPVDVQAAEARFESAVYELLRTKPAIRSSHLRYSRAPVQHPGPRLTVPLDLSGRRLFVFEKSEGENNVWTDLGPSNKLLLLDQLASMRVALFHYDPPQDFTAKYLLERLFQFMPSSLSMPVAPTREFWMHVLEYKIKATIQNEGDMIGWESDEETVGPLALAAKQSLLRAIPYLLPLDTPKPSLYRLVLEHGDFGIHNTTIMKQAGGEPLVTSLFDWETACIWPALLSDPLVAAGPVDLVVDEDGGPSVTRLPSDPAPADLETYATWAKHYINRLYNEAPDYETAIRAGKDFRYLWFALRDWRGANSEEFFGALGAWAEKRMQELGGS
ncbi:hypothetical protein QBC40DRAFT_289296 [Triangularia verruculosa]|uniref:Aminoglycoside phosphotransferase domain-containing protein n=1 Tax=Triangularia verruculosa TaxID=2587418 RepID=A0AAN7AQD6_9PEZI|nr:hypothetical protein QBC40DRAFT_289296 [Triangularia verruculosa]